MAGGGAEKRRYEKGVVELEINQEFEGLKNLEPARPRLQPGWRHAGKSREGDLIPQFRHEFSNERVFVGANIQPVLQADSSKELKAQKKRLRENCREFESVMISYMMKSMRDGTIRAEEPGNARGIYEDMLAGQVSQVISRNSALGIGDMLYSKLEHLVKVPANSNVLPAGAQTGLSAPSDKPESG